MPEFRNIPAADFERLTPAERKVLRALFGRTNAEAAQTLGLAPNTVANHLKAARSKLGMPNRGTLTWAFREWEGHSQDLASQDPAMVDPAAEPEEVRTDDELVREAKTPFVFLDQPAPAVPEAAPRQLLPHEKILVILVAAVLLLACFEYLPGLRHSAQLIGDGIDPLLQAAGVKRSG